jgi:hypothetical protein
MNTFSRPGVVCCKDILLYFVHNVDFITTNKCKVIEEKFFMSYTTTSF